ncbi:hypothetical protein [Methylocella sp. CPCC 101449]|uniref:hypothetical protein n=1 Tax=Methylocella sp. CPCC 101449 TaxID=2987531 RepID=UPI00288D507C|nr:hypothetical protein [Methylocella sp. CPCC 101449]MDT2024047.1 hypothetical protein [Methylocella sp. CPCC 101449]HEV2570630.1 hypothetical protein [Beijerinckiaceae bacterium]
MKTDWNLIRAMMGAAIDACERIEAAGYTENDRDAAIDIGGQQVSVHDFLVSAWTLPENLRYQIIRERHDQAADLPYVPETARVLVATAQASAELIGAGEMTPAGDGIQKMIRWFGDHAAPSIEQAVAARRLSRSS